MAPKRFVSWVAVSSRPQLDGGSPTDQRERNLAHMAKWNGCLVADLEVPGQSRSYIEYEEAKRQIEAYRELDALIKANAFDVLICYNVGRLGRDRPAEVNAWLREYIRVEFDENRKLTIKLS